MRLDHCMDQSTALFLYKTATQTWFLGINPGFVTNLGSNLSRKGLGSISVSSTDKWSELSFVIVVMIKTENVCIYIFKTRINEV